MSVSLPGNTGIFFLFLVFLKSGSMLNMQWMLSMFLNKWKRLHEKAIALWPLVWVVYEVCKFSIWKNNLLLTVLLSGSRKQEWMLPKYLFCVWLHNWHSINYFVYTCLKVKNFFCLCMCLCLWVCTLGCAYVEARGQSQASLLRASHLFFFFFRYGLPLAWYFMSRLG